MPNLSKEKITVRRAAQRAVNRRLWIFFVIIAHSRVWVYGDYLRSSIFSIQEDFKGCNLNRVRALSFKLSRRNFQGERTFPKDEGRFIFGWVQNYVRGWTREIFSSAVRSSIASRCPVWWWSYLGSSSGVWHLRFRGNTSSEDLWHGAKSARACPSNDNTVLELARSFVKSFEGLRITCLSEHFRPRNMEITTSQGRLIHQRFFLRISWYSRSGNE